VGQLAEVLADHRQHVESTKPDFTVPPVRVQRVEIGTAIEARITASQLRNGAARSSALSLQG
jgi:hypothetical protein